MFIDNGVIKTPDIQFDENCGGFGVFLFNLCQKYKENIALVSWFYIVKFKLTFTVLLRLTQEMMNSTPTMTFWRNVFPPPKPYRVKAFAERIWWHSAPTGKTSTPIFQQSQPNF